MCRFRHAPTTCVSEHAIQHTKTATTTRPLTDARLASLMMFVREPILSLSLSLSFIRSLPLICVDWMRGTNELLIDIVLTRGWFGLIWFGLIWFGLHSINNKTTVEDVE